MRIGQRQIGPEAPVYVIAELGVNHDGSPARAMELVEAAAGAGADAIKLQLFRTDLLMSRAAKLAAYQKAAGESDPVAMLQRLELPVEAMAPLVKRAHDFGVHAIVTVFSSELVPAAEGLPWDAYKTASPDVVNRPLLEALSATGRPLIVSTGAADADEVARAVGQHGWLAPCAGRLAVLQCVSCYPTRPADAAIGGMRALQGLGGFAGPAGYSDHTSEVDTGALAAELGACILEKHFTYSRRAAGPDHAASLEPAEFKAYADLARDASWLRLRLGGGGDGRGRESLGTDPRVGPFEKRVLECERDVRSVSRQSLVARRALGRGDALQAEDLTVKRPGLGIAPWRLAETLGRRLARAVEADMPIMQADLEGVT